MDRPFHERAPELGISEETEGDDDSLLTYHPASPEKMAELRLRFDDDDDARWVRSYMVSFYWANRWLITGVTSVVLVFVCTQ